ncbi:hypothetical protein FCI23_44130 [Actinacidiphila oryziradicis]|uniref:Uncharacterized protein n=1 Tax=Actinacidiphila oryziradicis TaxID=2571141 RepID=A0A4U0RUK9_9ACTN|nr:hypothetical protein FCI23_44130 [Actinacidiphila oryziradicis]
MIRLAVPSSADTMPPQPPPSGEQPSLPDDVWEEFVHDTEASIRDSAPKEPSARARMVTERLRQQDQATAGRIPDRRRQ